MCLTIRWRTAPPATHVVELVTPRTNGAAIGAVENLLAAIALAEPFALELAATAESRRFLVRAGSVTMRDHLAEQLRVAYPQAALRPLATGRHPGEDPAGFGPGEQAAARALVLRAPAYLPLRLFQDGDLDAARAAQADPVLGILGALGGLPPGWRALCQLVLAPAPDDWCRRYQRLALEPPLAGERSLGRAAPSPTAILLPAGLLLTGIAGWQVYTWYGAGEWLRLGLLGGGGLLGLPLLARRLRDRPVYDPRLIAEKIARPAYRAQLRLTVFAPSAAPAMAVAARLARLAAAYRQFTLASGNGLVPRPLALADRDLRTLAPLPPARATTMLLTTRELAGLWHLPQAGAEVTRLERTGARRRQPLPATVAEGCRIGVSDDGQGTATPVALPEGLLGRHLLLVGKTRRGKSGLLLRLFRFLADESPAPRPAVLLVDPHRDLAQAALGLVPASRRDDVVFLDVADAARPFGLNLLDTGLGWDRDGAVANALTVFQREFDQYWGPRMADSFRFGLLTLYEANEALCRSDPAGRERQHTILDVTALFTDLAFRRAVLKLVADPLITAWWTRYFQPLDRRLQLEIVNPVLTKINRFAGSWAARAIVGQPRSTIDPAGWVRQGQLVVVNGAKGTVGEDSAALIGGTLINLVALAVAGQTGLAPAARRPVTLLIDEFHAMPGADFESILAEQAKYGANLVLATQSLARLDALDRQGHRALRATVFANLDGLFAFHCSAEDARYLIPELGGEREVEVADLVALGEHHCYARLSTGGTRPPAFLLRLDPPPPSDPALAATLAAASARRWGRPRQRVEEDLVAAQARIAAAQWGDGADAGTAGQGVDRDPPGPAPRDQRGKRGRSRRPPPPDQRSFLASGMAPSADGGGPAGTAADAERGRALGSGGTEPVA